MPDRRHPDTPDLVVRGDRVVTPDGVHPAAVHVAAGVIRAVTGPGEVPTGAPVVEAGEAVVLPGLVDTHVHVNEPGRTDWEGFATATRAAAAGGVTTIVDMPLNSVPPTTTVAGLAAKRAAAAGSCWVDVGFWGGAVPGNTADLAALDADGVLGFKCFLVDSGVEEFPALDGAGLDAALAALAPLDALLLAHAEDPAELRAPAGDPRRHATWLDSRPAAAEERAVAALLAAAARHGTRVHVVHLSAASALPAIAAARAAGQRVTTETCPHYLTLAAEDVPDGATACKCAPPIRGADNRDGLWAGLADGTIDLVVSDHSPSPPEGKRLDTGDFLGAWGGISSLQLGLPVVWTAASARGFGLDDLARWMAAAPACLVGLDAKGAIAPGRDADLVLFDPDATWTVDPAALEHRHPVTPYAGARLRGRVRATYLRGARVVGEGAVAPDPAGRLLGRPTSWAAALSQVAPALGGGPA